MKKSIFFTPLILLFFSWTWKKKYDYEIPPGTVRIEENFFVDQTEIRNVDWREFTYWIAKHEGVDSFITCLPDTNVWNCEHKYQSFVELYYRHPAYSDYPIVGISQHMAKVYAKWRTHRVLKYMLIRDKKEINVNLNGEKCFTPEKYFNGNWQNAQPDTSFKFPVYRLPSKHEWLNFSLADTFPKYPFEFTIGDKIGFRDRIDSSYFICKQKQEISMHFPYLNITMTSPVRSGLLNSKSLFNCIGNVSEIIDEDSTAMGGNFETYASSLNLLDTLHFNQPEHWLGFRCVAEFMNWREYQEYLNKSKQ